MTNYAVHIVDLHLYTIGCAFEELLKTAEKVSCVLCCSPQISADLSPSAFGME